MFSSYTVRLSYLNMSAKQRRHCSEFRLVSHWQLEPGMAIRVGVLSWPGLTTSCVHHWLPQAEGEVGSLQLWTLAPLAEPLPVTAVDPHWQQATQAGMMMPVRRPLTMALSLPA